MDTDKNYGEKITATISSEIIYDDLESEVIRRSHVNYNNCYHCRCCAGGCPFIQAMDYAPHGVS